MGGTYREFIFFDEQQVYPEYAVIYRRQYDKSQVPKLMRQNTRGTTGKSWQVHIDGKGWANMPPDVTQELNTALDQGRLVLERVVGGTMYKFDLSNRQQIHVPSGTL